MVNSISFGAVHYQTGRYTPQEEPKLVEAFAKQHNLPLEIIDDSEYENDPVSYIVGDQQNSSKDKNIALALSVAGVPVETYGELIPPELRLKLASIAYKELSK